MGKNYGGNRYIFDDGMKIDGDKGGDEVTK